MSNGIEQLQECLQKGDVHQFLTGKEVGVVYFAFRCATRTLTLSCTWLDLILGNNVSLRLTLSLEDSTISLLSRMLLLYLTILFTCFLTVCSKQDQNATEKYCESLHDGRGM